MTDLILVSNAELADACVALRRGEVIGLPTETVYGLAGDARNAEALRQIFAIKGRPADHPLLKRKVNVLDLVTGGQDTIGLRVPNHPVALALLQAFGSGLAAPSANRFGHVSPTTA